MRRLIVHLGLACALLACQMSNTVAALALCATATTDCCAVETGEAACPLTMQHAEAQSRGDHRLQAVVPSEQDSAPPCSFCLGCPERLPAPSLVRVGAEHQVASAAIPQRMLALLPRGRAPDLPPIAPKKHLPRYILHHSLLI